MPMRDPENVFEALELARGFSHLITLGACKSEEQVALGLIWRALRTGKAEEAMAIHSDWVNSRDSLEEVLERHKT